MLVSGGLLSCNLINQWPRCYDFQWRAVNLSKRIRHTEKIETNEGFKRCEWTAKWRCEVSGEILYSSDKRGKTSSCVAANNSFHTHRWRRVLIGLVFTYFCFCSILVSRRRVTHTCLSFECLKNSLPFLIQSDVRPKPTWTTRKISRASRHPKNLLPLICDWPGRFRNHSYRSTQVPQTTNFCLWATGKTFFSYRVMCWAPGISWLGTFWLLKIILYHSLAF